MPGLMNVMNGSWRERRTVELLRGRVSTPGARYFITACTADRKAWFIDPTTSAIAKRAMMRMHDDGDVVWIAGTVMPDHVHLLFELGERLELRRLIAKLKGLVSRQVTSAFSISQENVFEHRLRPEEDIESYGFYIFMNPYRAGLIDMEHSWPGWICSYPKRFEFLERTREGEVPQSEWLDMIAVTERDLSTGE